MFFSWFLLCSTLLTIEAHLCYNVTEDCLMDLILVIDNSRRYAVDANGNYSAERWNLVKGFFQRLVRTLDVGPSTTRVAAVLFGNGGKVAFRLSSWETKGQVVDAIDGIETTAYGSSNNQIFPGLYAASLSIIGNHDDIPEIPNVLVVITDTVPDKDMIKLVAETNKTKTNGTSIIGIEVANTESVSVMKMIVTEPSSDNYFRVSGLDNLKSSVDAVAMATCRLARDQINAAGGVRPTRNTSSPTIGCKMDLAFAIDDWKTIATDANGVHNATKWNLILDFFQSLVRSLDVGPDTIRISFLTFGSYSAPYFDFTRIQTTDYVVNSMSNIPYRGDQVHHSNGKKTGNAILTANHHVFQAIRGERRSIPNVFVMLTDYITETELLMREVNKARHRFNTSIIGIGFSHATNATLMEMVVERPTLDNYIEVPRLENLNAIVDAVAVTICRAAKRRLSSAISIEPVNQMHSTVQQQDPELTLFETCDDSFQHYCFSGGTCFKLTDGGRESCRCARGFEGKRCEKKSVPELGPL